MKQVGTLEVRCDRCKEIAVVFLNQTQHEKRFVVWINLHYEAESTFPLHVQDLVGGALVNLGGGGNTPQQNIHIRLCFRS